MKYEDLATMAREAGFSDVAPLCAADVALRADVRAMCAQNTCGQYAKRWSCPPGCGELELCERQIAGHPAGILVQSVGDVEDSFDFDAMQDLEKLHKARFLAMYDRLRGRSDSVLALGAGCCTVCEQCTYPHAPCRFPEKMVSSMEAYGIMVMDVCKNAGLAYYYGPGKMAYTSCFLLK